MHGFGLPTRRRWHSYWLSWPAPQPVHAEHECRATHPGALLWIALVSLPFLHVLPAVRAVRGGDGAVLLFLIILAEVLLALAVAGWVARRNWRGVTMALGQRYVTSLSVTQAIAWTAVFTAATLTAVFLGADLTSMEAQVPLQVGLAGGTVAVGTGLTVRKLTRAANDNAKDQLLQDLRVDSGAAAADPTEALERLRGHVPTVRRLEKLRCDGDLAMVQAAARSRQEGHKALAELITSNRHGLLFGNVCPCQARILDMLEGDEVGNAVGLDASKVQFAAIATTGLAVYLGAFATGLAGGDGGLGVADPGAMPLAMVEAYAVSSAAYLGLKAPMQTPQAPAGVPPAAAGASLAPMPPPPPPALPVSTPRPRTPRVGP